MAKYVDAEKIEYPYMTMSMWGLNSKDCHSYNEGVKAVEDKISALPVADVVEVKHGKWIDLGRSYYTVISQCSECGAKYDFRSPYCPNCGAKMDGERKQ